MFAFAWEQTVTLSLPMFSFNHMRQIIKKIITDKRMTEAKAFNFAFGYMDNFLSINNSNFDNLILLRHPLWTWHTKVRGIGPGENHRHAGSHWQTLSQNVVLSTPPMDEIRTYNFSSDRHRVYM